jgi:hypothetical protein
LPKVFNKLKDFGLPIELLVFKPIVSLYSNTFSTDIVLRLWDLIFFMFSQKNKSWHKRGLWYILGPAYLILKRKERQIMESPTCEDIMKVFSGGCALWFDPQQFINELYEVCQSIFVED